MIQHKLVDFEFDMIAFGQAIEASGVSDDTISQLLEIAPETVKRWRTANHNTVPYPSMTNFIRVINLLGLNPSQFFVLKETK